MSSVAGLKFQDGARYPTGRTPAISSTAATACSSRRRSVAASSWLLRSCIQPCTAISCRPLALMTPACPGASFRLQAGKKKVAGTPSRSSDWTMRGNATREPYSPCESDPMLT